MLTRPRPPRSCLVAGRFLVSRAALLARQSGPLAAVDVATAGPVRLAWASPGLDRDALRAAVGRWNGLARAAAPPVLELVEHDGAPVLVLTARAGLPLRSASGVERLAFERAAATLGAALDESGLGLLPGRDPELAVHAGELALCVPAVGPADPARPLAVALPAAVPRAAPAAAATLPPSGRRPGRRRPDRVAVLLQRRPGRALVLALAAGALALGFALAGSLLGPAGPATASPSWTAAIPPEAVPAASSPAPARTLAPAPRRPAVHARGGPSRVVVGPRPRRISARARASPPARPPAPPPTRAWRRARPPVSQPRPDPQTALCRAQGLCW